jgi:hypothetical protein
MLVCSGNDWVVLVGIDRRTFSHHFFSFGHPVNRYPCLLAVVVSIEG